MAKEQRRLAAVLAADVAGYSRLMGRDESGTLAALKALRREVVDPALAAHGGRIVKTSGDGLLAEFASVVDAVHCVIEVQTAMAAKTGPVPEDRRIAFRVGVNLGDIIIDGDDIFGDGVNIAARLEALAEPGGLCLSEYAFHQVRGKIDAGFVEMGAQTLKNIDQPVRAWRWSPTREPAAPIRALALPDKPSIAVLPFQNMSGDPEQEYFADGIVEDIITALSRFKSLFVIARNSSFTYKGKAVDIKQVGRELGVRYVLEGSVRRTAGRVRITGQLIDSQTGAHVWADRFDGALEDVFELQDQIATKVAAQLPLMIQQAEIERVRTKPTANLGAYDSYLLGMRSIHALSTRDSTDQALRHYYRAIELDPEYAEPHAWASIAYSRRRQAQWMTDVRKECAEGVRLGRRAAELRPDSALTLNVAGFALAFMGGETAAGIDFIERSLALNPNDAQTWHGSGWVRIYNGEPDLAIEHLDRAERLSPLDPQTFQYDLARALAHFCAGRYLESAAAAGRAMKRQPELAHGYTSFARSMAMAGRLEEARQAMARALELNPNLRISTPGAVAFMRRPDDIARLREALRLAGMPE